MKLGVIKKILSGILIGTLSISLMACGNKKDEVKLGGVEKIKDSGKLVVATSADYPPYEFHKIIDGKDKIIGFDIDIANEVAKDLGVKLEITDMDFDGLLIALQAGKADMVFAGMTPTPKRQENADFSKIYYNAVHGVLVRAEDIDKIKTLEDLNGKKLGVQKGSIQEEIAKEQIAGAEIKALGKVTDLVLDLKSGKVDALLVEKPVGEFNVKQNTAIALTDITIKDEEGGSAIAMKKGETELVNQVNKTIDRLINEGKIDEFVVDANKHLE